MSSRNRKILPGSLYLALALTVGACGDSCRYVDSPCGLAALSGMAIVALPVAIPASMANGVDRLADDGPMLGVINPDPSHPVTQHDVAIEINDSFSSSVHAFQAGTGRFLVLQPKLRNHRTVWAADFFTLDGKQYASPANYPEDFIFSSPLGIGPDGLVFCELKDHRQRDLVAIDPDSGKRTLYPVHDCGSGPQLSQNGLFVAFYERTGFTVHDVTSGQAIVSAEAGKSRGFIRNAVINDRGDLLINYDKEVRLFMTSGEERSIDIPTSATPVATGNRFIVPLSFRSDKEKGSHITIKEILSEKILTEFDLDAEIDNKDLRVYAISNDTVVLKNKKQAYVVSLLNNNEGAPLIIGIERHHKATLQALFAKDGRWLLFISNSLSRFFLVDHSLKES